MRSAFLLTVLAVFLIPGVALAQHMGHGHPILIPDTSIERPEHVGLQAHTNHLLRFDPEATGTAPAGETPASLKAVYNLPAYGGQGVIALVAAYDYPTAENDLNLFSTTMGLGPCTTANGCFLKLYASGKKPQSNCGWAQEAALDVEWSHAMAPYAKIVLVEAASSSFTDLFTAVDVARQQVINSGKPGQVSMSWGGSEFSSETSYDSHFKVSGVVFFAASGDSGGQTIYPSVSPWVVAAGGTSVNRTTEGNPNTAFLSETGWSGSGGGSSRYEPLPSWQSGVVSGSHRGAPDLSFDADPNTGVSVYDSTKCQGMSGWMVFGGTSVSSPAVAGIANLAGSVSNSSSSELSLIYAYRGTSNFYDVLSGSAGRYSAAKGWDYVTGVGSPRGLVGK
ncbi:MAG: S53 family peptidase [Bryobacteraceae bacterium]|jgi:subtilase family serine protease